mgnify:CR=1 FL=1
MSNNADVKTILIVLANPANTLRLRLDEEAREIDAAFRRADKRKQFNLAQKWAVRSRDFFQAILDYQPQIVHFCGHSAGEDGIFVSLRSTSLKELLKVSKIGIVSSLLDKLIYLIHQSDPKYAIGVNEVRNAVDNKSIESLIYSNAILEKLDEVEFIDLLNSTEAVGAKIYGVDASTDIGLRVSSLGGIVGLLRFAIR